MKIKKRAAFTLVEIMFVVAIIGLLASMATGNYIRTREKAQINVLVNDLRVFASAFRLYSMEQGDWPKSQKNRDSYPESMEDYLGDAWSRPSTVGGKYSWTHRRPRNPVRKEAFIQIRSDGRKNRIFASKAQLVEVDSILDDGDPKKGDIQVRGSNRFYYYLKVKNQ